MMLHTPTTCALILSLLTSLAGPEPDGIPRPKQSIVPVGLVPHAPPTPGLDLNRPSEGTEASAGEPEPEPEVDLTVVYMPPKKKALGINAPSAPLSCDEPTACRRIILVGGVAGGVAAVLLGVGSVFLAQPERVAPPPSSPTQGRAVGWTIVGAGISSAAIGGLLLFAGLRGRKQRRIDQGRALLRGEGLRF